MNILVEGWRGINHSYALVNQWQVKELIKLSNVYFKDIPYFNENWSSEKNDSGLNKKVKNIVNSIQPPLKDIEYDVTYRISAPFNFNPKFNSKVLFVFGSTEYRDIHEKNYINGKPNLLCKEERFFIHTPSNWSKKGFQELGFREDQIIIIPHGIDLDTFDLISLEEKKNIRNKYKVKDDDFILTNIGAMFTNKGVENLIAAYGILKKKNKNLKLILKDQSNLYNIKANAILKRVFDSNFNQKYNIFNDEMFNDIIILSKNLSFNELHEIYSITDCYVSPYTAEGFNLTPLEAAACGTQIIVTNKGSTDDYFDECMGFKIESEERKAGNRYFLYPKIDSLIEILSNTINKPDDKKLTRSKFVRKNFSWEKVVKKLKKEFEKKLSK